jgi:hypothetical protein
VPQRGGTEILDSSGAPSCAGPVNRYIPLV